MTVTLCKANGVLSVKNVIYKCFEKLSHQFSLPMDSFNVLQCRTSVPDDVIGIFNMMSCYKMIKWSYLLFYMLLLVLLVLLL